MAATAPRYRGGSQFGSIGWLTDQSFYLNVQRAGGKRRLAGHLQGTIANGEDLPLCCEGVPRRVECRVQVDYRDRLFKGVAGLDLAKGPVAIDNSSGWFWHRVAFPPTIADKLD